MGFIIFVCGYIVGRLDTLYGKKYGEKIGRYIGTKARKIFKRKLQK